MHIQTHMNIEIDNPENTWIISDFHFDHTNIIRYCKRGFKDVESMNNFMLASYKAKVRSDSTVIFVGDMAFGSGSRTPRWWLSNIAYCKRFYYAKGSHDKGIRPTSMLGNNITVADSFGTVVGGKQLLFIHNPLNKPSDYKEWIIHGHTHRLNTVDYADKTICVSVEALDYVPISLLRVMELILIM